MTDRSENVDPVFHTFGPVRWWGFTHEHSPHRHAELRIGRVRLHAEAWVNRYPVSTSRRLAALRTPREVRDVSAQHRSMDDQFEARLTAWLDDPDAETSGDQLSPVADGYAIAKRAFAEAAGHETCVPDARAFTMLIGVSGADGEETIHEVPPGTTLMCILGAVSRDPETAAMRVIGILADDLPEELPDGIRVTSENPDIAVSWNDDEPEEEPVVVEPEPPKQAARRWFLWARKQAAPKPRPRHLGAPGQPYTYPADEWTQAAPDEVGPFD